VGSAVATATFVAVAAALAWSATSGVAPAWSTAPFTVASGVLGGFLVASRPRNAVGWCFSSAGLLFAVGALAEQYAGHSVVVNTRGAWGADVALWLQAWVYLPAVVLVVVFIPTLFPDGSVPSGPWRVFTQCAVVLSVAGTALSAIAPGEVRLGAHVVANPFGLDALEGLGWLTGAAPGVAWLVMGLISVVGFVVRVRRTTGERRLQMHWLAYAYALVAATLCLDLVVAWAVPDLYPVLFPVVQLVPAVIPIAAFIGVVRYRLLDLDTLVNRTLVYVVLTSALVVAYVAAVRGLAAVLDLRGGVAGQLIATALVAAAFAPVRDVLQRGVNRLLYGDRNDPHHALVHLGRQLSGAPAPGDVVPAITRAVVETLRVPYARLEVQTGAGPVLVGWSGRPTDRAPDGADTSELVEVPLVHAGKQVGRLGVATRGPRQPLSSKDHRLLEDLARQIGPTIEGIRLGEDLRRSRDELLSAREEERRRVGADLHDGIGPQLASVAMRLEATRDLLHTDPARASQRLLEAQGAVERTIVDVRQTAHALRPPVLHTLGLAGALRAQTTAASAVRVDVEIDPGLPTLSAAVEVAAYFIALEALRNAQAHASATRCVLALRRDGDGVRLTVTDNGRGMSANRRTGLGLTSMTERARELGGDLDVTSHPGSGTTVTAALPCERERGPGPALPPAPRRHDDTLPSATAPWAAP
jgi:signal transduction histidine kinase